MVGLPKLDRIDVNILAQLQQNSRLTNVDLAEAVGLSPSPCLARVKRLEKAGYIASYSARLNLSKLVDHILVFTEVTLNDHKREDFIKFETEIRRYEAVQECHLVSGGYDYLLKFVCRSVAAYQELMELILERNIGIEKYFSYIVIKSVIQRDSVPLKSLLSD
ncbi:winged helix-turn-helix transcriptional regulator [Mesorhizobium sp. M0152]|uniref:Lrp/AsnC family transcriptional regulator n=1 Tax=unclassified Mesorhizobium TaxID=325217 RepID=UPI00333B1B90